MLSKPNLGLRYSNGSSVTKFTLNKNLKETTKTDANTTRISSGHSQAWHPLKHMYPPSTQQEMNISGAMPI